MKSAFITGILGQDGTYLARLLVHKGYRVHGMVRGSLRKERARILARFPAEDRRRLCFHTATLEDKRALRRALSAADPDEIYHLAGVSDSRRSFEIPEQTLDSITLGSLRLLEAVRQTGRPIRVFCASSCEVFGVPTQTPQTERTERRPVTPYGIAKDAADNLVRLYRDTYGLFLVTGILFNHESPLRPDNYLSRRVAQAVAAIKKGKQHELKLGRLDAQRDWSDARDFVRGFHLALRADQPDDYLFASGECHTVGELVKCAFQVAGLNDTDYVRAEAGRLGSVPVATGLCGDARKARRILGWERSWSFPQTIADMVQAEMEQRSLLQRGDPLPRRRRVAGRTFPSRSVARQPRLNHGR